VERRPADSNGSDLGHARLEEAAASFRTSVETIRKKAEMLGLAWKRRDGRKSRLQTKGYN
jgi:hypothetical protein